MAANDTLARRSASARRHEWVLFVKFVIIRASDLKRI